MPHHSNARRCRPRRGSNPRGSRHLPRRPGPGRSPILPLAIDPRVDANGSRRNPALSRMPGPRAHPASLRTSRHLARAPRAPRLAAVHACQILVHAPGPAGVRRPSRPTTARARRTTSRLRLPVLSRAVRGRSGGHRARRRTPTVPAPGPSSATLPATTDGGPEVARPPRAAPGHAPRPSGDARRGRRAAGTRTGSRGTARDRRPRRGGGTWPDAGART